MDTCRSRSTTCTGIESLSLARDLDLYTVDLDLASRSTVDSSAAVHVYMYF